MTIQLHPLRRHRASRLLAAGAALIGAAALVFTGAAAPAAAHDELIASSPTSGEVLETAPEVVELTFSDDVIETGTVIEVVDHHGDPIEVGAVEVLGPEVSATLPGDLSGEYQVRWRAVSSDGHPIEGTIDFGVGAGATGVWASEAPHDGGADDGDDAATTGSAVEGGPDGWAVAAFVVGGLVILGLVIMLVVRTTRRRPPGAEAP